MQAGIKPNLAQLFRAHAFCLMVSVLHFMAEVRKPLSCRLGLQKERHVELPRSATQIIKPRSQQGREAKELERSRQTVGLRKQQGSCRGAA
jgi:non-homologous end joining protein Ku